MLSVKGIPLRHPDVIVRKLIRLKRLMSSDVVTSCQQSIPLRQAILCLKGELRHTKSVWPVPTFVRTQKSKIFRGLPTAWDLVLLPASTLPPPPSFLLCATTLATVHNAPAHNSVTE